MGLHCLSGYSLVVVFRLVFAFGGCLPPFLRCLLTVSACTSVPAFEPACSLQFCLVRGSGPAVSAIASGSPFSGLLLVAMCFLPLLWVGRPLQTFRHQPLAAHCFHLVPGLRSPAFVYGQLVSCRGLASGFWS